MQSALVAAVVLTQLSDKDMLSSTRLLECRQILDDIMKSGLIDLIVSSFIL